MDRALHILIASFVIVLLSWPTWRLRSYIRGSGCPAWLALAGYAAVKDINLFAIIYAWFDLFSLRDLIFFIVVHNLAVTIPYLVWRFYSPTLIPWKFACVRVYLELYFSDRRWLFVVLSVTSALLSIGAVVTFYWGLALVHHANYPSIFTVLTVSGGIALLAAAVPCVWILMHVALEDSARVRLLLALYSSSIFVFVCALMAGPRMIAHDIKIRLLDSPYHLQIPLNIATVVTIILVGFLIGFSLPMFLGGVRQAGEVRGFGDFEEDLLRRLKRGLRPPNTGDEVSFIERMMDDLRNQEESLRGQLVTPGFLFRTDSEQDAPISSVDAAVDQELDAAMNQDLLAAMEEEDLEKIIEEDLKRIRGNANRWTTEDAWNKRLAELQILGKHAEALVKVYFVEEMENKRSWPVRSFSKIRFYCLSITLNGVASWFQGWIDYYRKLESKDFRWHHLFWLQSLRSEIGDTRDKINRLHRARIRLHTAKKRGAYIKECLELLDEKLDSAIKSAKDVREEKRFGGRFFMPFAVPLTMAIVSPFIHIGLGFGP